MRYKQSSTHRRSQMDKQLHKSDTDDVLMRVRNLKKHFHVSSGFLAKTPNI